MDLSESMQIVSSRIQEVEPELSSKIIGYLLLQEFGDRCIIRLAFSPDDVIRNVAGKVKHIINLLNQQQQLQQLQQQIALASVSHPLNNPLQYCNPYRGFPDFQPCSNSNMPLSASWNVQGANGLEEQFQRSLTFEDDYSNSELHSSYGYPDQPGFAADKVSKRLRNLSEFPPKVCHYFIKGGCKHGNNCRFFHGNPMALESFSELLGHRSSDIGYRNRNLIDDHSMFPVGSLEKLELDLIELLRSNGGPISISTLPMMYYEKYGRTLQAEGYLTESQRHGKVGYSLTRLLARLKNSISVIDRPHGQHSVILVEDAPKYLEYPSDDRSENGVIVPGSRQIYLTFPAESEFSETDVSNYFNTYGPVQDVRIPSQEKRMFGFVTFVYPETVTKILAKANPHFVCGARVLVKPYREKSRLVDRKHAEKLQRCMHNDSHVFDGDPEFQFLPRASDYSRLMRQQFMEERKEALEQEITSLSESQLLPKPSARLQYFANSIDELKLAQEFPTWEQSDYSRLSNLNIGSSSEETFRYMNTTYDTQESNEVLNLPDNPFATSTSYDT